MLSRTEATATIAILADRVLQRDHGVPQAILRDNWEVVWHEVVNPDWEEDVYPADVLTALCECGWAFVDKPEVNFNIRLIAEAPDTIDINSDTFELRVIWPEEKIEFVVTSLTTGEIYWPDWTKAVLKNNISHDQVSELWRRLGINGFFSIPF